MRATLSPPQTRPLSGGKFRFSLRAVPCFNALPLQARLGLLFLFCLSFARLFSLPRGGAGFLSSRFAVVPDSFKTGSRWLNRACLRLGWCCFPTRLSKPHTGPHRVEFVFPPQNEFTPPPKGGGAGFRSSLGFRVLLGSCLWQLLATAGSHASNKACLGLRRCRSPTRLSKSHTGPHRGEFGSHFLFLVRFFCGRPANCRSRW